MAGGEPSVELDGEFVVVRVPLTDGALLAAAALDRALAIEPSRYGGSSSQAYGLEEQGRAFRLRLLAKRIGAAVRSVS